MTLGVRPEDVALCPVEESNLYGDVYSVEMNGECTLITVQVDEHCWLVAQSYNITGMVNATAWALSSTLIIPTFSILNLNNAFIANKQLAVSKQLNHLA